MKKKQWIGIVVAGVVFIAVCATGIFSNVVQSKLTENDMLDFLYEDIYSIKRELITLLSVENR